MQEIVSLIVEIVGEFGYIGIFIMMFLESTFFPFPSEVAMIPAGYLASKGEMNIFIVLFVGIFGSLSGALFNYYLAKLYGKKGVLAFGKYFFFTKDKLEVMEVFFIKHGSFSTFVSRLIPGVRQLISIPAGLFNMDIKKFLFYTTMGISIWVIILTLLGYFIGENEILLKEYLHQILYIIFGGIFITTIIYIFKYKNK
jgi:membrane protein DedA with SNARE-associated domain